MRARSRRSRTASGKSNVRAPRTPRRSRRARPRARGQAGAGGIGGTSIVDWVQPLQGDPTDRSQMLAMSVPDLVSQKVVPRSGPVSIICKGGRVVTAELSGYDIRLPGRRARMVMAADADTGRRAEEALRESERRFREMLDTIELAAVLIDVVGSVTYCNPYLLSISGYTKDEVIGKNFFELFLQEKERAAASRGIATIALTDHDSIAGVEAARAEGCSGNSGPASW